MAAQAQGNADEAINKELEPEAVLEKARRLEAHDFTSHVARRFSVPPGSGPVDRAAGPRVELEVRAREDRLIGFLGDEAIPYFPAARDSAQGPTREVVILNWFAELEAALAKARK